jgi:outer membrane protein OmpA-like peptidoglycan-associated protein
MKRALVFSFVVLPLALVASQASAQTTGYAVNRFDPAEKGSDWFSNESLDLRGKLRPALGLVGDYSTNNIAYYNYDGSHQAALVGKQFFMHIGASLTIADRLRLGVSLPVALYQNGQNYTLGTTPLTPPSKAAIGDLRLGADVRLVGEYKDAFTMAIGAQVHLPTGVESQYTGDGKVDVQPRLLIAGDLADVAYAAKIGFEFRGRDDVFAGTQLGNNLTGSVALGLRAVDRHLLIGPEFFASTLASQAFNHLVTPVEGLLGAHYFVDGWRFGLGAGGGIGDIYSSPSFRLLMGIEWSPAIEEKPADRDGDGVLDKDDACPDVAGVATDDPKTNGCPVAKPSDRDGDGILDADDACPDVPGVKTDDPKTNGCPADKDGDGIPDAQDACPDVPGVKTDDPKTNGCPADKDGDGIPDAQDACPDVPGVKTDNPKTNGCPPDRDGDGIPDSVDACPDKPGIASDDPKKNGCPALAAISNGMIKISEQVQFKTGSATILPASTNLMNAVLGIMKEHPEIKLVHIEGHTDNKGAAAANKTLSQKRAAAVVGWLVMHGIDKSRMDAQGYGQERPIDSNNTDEGRQNNRRVEFHIDGGGTGSGGGTTTPR